MLLSLLNARYLYTYKGCHCGTAGFSRQTRAASVSGDDDGTGGEAEVLMRKSRYSTIRRRLGRVRTAGTFITLETWCGWTMSGWSVASAGRRSRLRRRLRVQRLGSGIPGIS